MRNRVFGACLAFARRIERPVLRNKVFGARLASLLAPFETKPILLFPHHVQVDSNFMLAVRRPLKN